MTPVYLVGKRLLLQSEIFEQAKAQGYFGNDLHKALNIIRVSSMYTKKVK